MTTFWWFSLGTGELLSFFLHQGGNYSILILNAGVGEGGCDIGDKETRLFVQIFKCTCRSQKHLPPKTIMYHWPDLQKPLILITKINLWQCDELALSLFVSLTNTLLPPSAWSPGAGFCRLFHSIFMVSTRLWRSWKAEGLTSQSLLQLQFYMKPSIRKAGTEGTMRFRRGRHTWKWRLHSASSSNQHIVEVVGSCNTVSRCRA